jgi:hypothetical protein
MAQERWSQQDSGHDFAEDRGLIEFLHQLAGEFGGAEQHGEGDEHVHDVVWSKMRHSLKPLACKQ